MAQVVVVNAPASLEGAYVWETGFGADLTTDIWTGDAVIVDDGSAVPNEGCEASTIDYTGKIVLIDRGACQFGLKCLNAENAGALGVVIFNNQPGGPIPMGAGVDGALVTIPCVMLSLEDGTMIKDAMANGETVNITIGNLQFDNNISATTSTVTVPIVGTIPSSQINETGDYTFSPAALVINDGLMDANNVSVDATIDFTPFGGASSQVYVNNVSTGTIPIDTSEFLVLPEFDISGSEAGVYTVNYSINSDMDDELPFDNFVSNEFTISENVYSRSNWDIANGRPARTNAFTSGGGGNIEFLSSFIIKNGLGMQIDSVTFYTATNLDNLNEILVSVLLYEWIDLNADSTMNNEEMFWLGFNDISFDTTATAGEWRTVPIVNSETFTNGYPIPQDGGTYVIGTRYLGAETVFFGFNEAYDLLIQIAQGGVSENGQGLLISDAELPYIGTNGVVNDILPDVESGFLFTALGGTPSTAMWISLSPVGVEELTDAELQINMYPNPVSTLLTAEINLDEPTSQLEYKITDINGRLIFQTQKDNVTIDKSDFNVAQLPAGQYIMTIQTDKGFRSEMFSVNR